MEWAGSRRQVADNVKDLYTIEELHLRTGLYNVTIGLVGAAEVSGAEHPEWRLV